MKVGYFQFSHGLCQEKTVQQQHGIHTNSLLNCMYRYKKETVFQVNTVCMCLCYRINKNILQDANLPFLKAKIMHKAILKKSHLRTIHWQSLCVLVIFSNNKIRTYKEVCHVGQLLILQLGKAFPTFWISETAHI